MAPTIVLITGASRGLGRGLAQRFLAKPNHVVIAANRDPSGETSRGLQDLPKGEGSRLIIVKLDSAVEADAIEAVKTLETEGIDSLDIVVANAGISEVYPAVSAVNASDLQKHITINVLGVIWLYQAVLPLLRKSPDPKWVTMGSSAGSLEVGSFLFASDYIPFMHFFVLLLLDYIQNHPAQKREAQLTRRSKHWNNIRRAATQRLTQI